MSTILNEFGSPYRFAHGADRSRYRGPQFARLIGDIDKLITTADRRTLSALSNRLFFNFGIIKTIAHQRADFSVGAAWLPTYIGAGDQDQGFQAARYMESVWYPQCDIRGGVFDWWQLLYLTSVAMDRDGDCFWIMVRGDDNFPRIQIIPSHRCWNKEQSDRINGGMFDGYRCNDGVIYFASGRPAGYLFEQADGSMAQIPAADVIHFFDPAYAEQGRGYPLFSHALEDIKDCMASIADERMRQVIMSRIHLIVNNETGGPDIDDPLNDVENLSGTSGSMVSQQFPGGIYYQPGDGQHKIEQLKQENPGAAWESFQDRLIRNTIVGAEWATTLAWKGPGQGTAERAEILKARNAIRRRQGILWHSKRAFSWAYSIFADQGFVPRLPSPTMWDFSMPPRLTVDDGRESKAELEGLRYGSINIDEVLSSRGVSNPTMFFRQRARLAAIEEIERLAAEKEFNVSIDPRKMGMLTPNEQAPQSNTETHEEDED
jgi:hypothetical protein